MSYCSQQDIEDRFSTAELVQLTDRDNSDAINVTVVAKAIADADNLIDSWVSSGGYATPLVQTPGAINRAACDIVRYYLWEDASSEEVRNRYKDAIKYLNSVANGSVTLSLGDEDSGADQNVATGLTQFSTPSTKLDLSGY